MLTRRTDLPMRLSDRIAYRRVVQFPVVCFVVALGSDLAYWQTENFLWETFSVWLLAAGCVMAGVAGLVGLYCFATDRRLYSSGSAWLHALASLIVAALAVVNTFVHSRDGYTAVVPTGLALSTVVVLLMLLISWLDREKAPNDARNTTGVTA